MWCHISTPRKESAQRNKQREISVYSRIHPELRASLLLGKEQFFEDPSSVLGRGNGVSDGSGVGEDLVIVTSLVSLSIDHDQLGSTRNVSARSVAAAARIRLALSPKK